MKKLEEKSDGSLLEDRDYYFENGLMVFTAEFLRRRGYCCGNGCRHCPYPATEDQSKKSSNSL